LAAHFGEKKFIVTEDAGQRIVELVAQQLAKIFFAGERERQGPADAPDWGRAAGDERSAGSFPRGRGLAHAMFHERSFTERL
jgi:hypothetical protein